MFDIGFWEMALVAVVALVVVGPRDLPVLLRNVSSWITRAREVASEFRNELSREAAHAEELKKMVERETEIAELHKLLDEARAQIPLDAPEGTGETGSGASGQGRDERSP